MAISARRLSRSKKQQSVLPTTTPADVTGLQLWLKADAITGVANGATFMTWPDSSGNNHSATTIPGNTDPTYVTNAANGLPVVRFNGNQTLQSSASSSYAAQTIIVVAKPLSLTGYGTFRGSGSGGLQARIVDGYPNLVRESVAEVGGSSTLQVSSAAYQVISYRYATTGVYSIWIGTTPAAGGATSVTALSAGLPSLIGSKNSTEYYSGDIAELASYDRYLTDEEVTNLTNGFVEKWGASYLAVPDTTRPPAPVITSAASTTDTTPTISGTGEAGCTITIGINSHTYTGTVDGSGNWSVTITDALTAGNTYALTASARDASGNVSQVVTTQDLTITGAGPDTTPPAAPAVTSSATTNSLTPTINGTAEANSVINYTINAHTYTATTSTGGTWSLVVANALTAGQSYPYSVTATDSSNNVSTAATGTLAVSASAGTFTGTKVAIIGDSLTWQGGAGPTSVPAAFTAAGWPTTAPTVDAPTIGTYFDGVDGMPIQAAPAHISACRSSQFGEPDVWVIALCSNNGSDPIASVNTYIDQVFTALGSTAKLLWVNLGTENLANTDHQAVNQAIATKLSGRPHSVLADWYSYIGDQGNPANWWTDGVHMTALGYSKRNAFIAQKSIDAFSS